ncbi:LuxR C-terminal-related transcriptional regulator [Arthrobacter sp. H35-D1]|uniref:LuxR C-terminal-related transcriptional regulator n=1 Tax=Arthrobacter sp. H35-D1 TaxID=3046202 RepID=UPI0024BABB8D|nr:LuxR C-terminal-related transcriptional regulator [Arthrobacter sp. H35-D1]MDJ0312325.1 LuxR C-terminal-related transcriptional regulator [Arthrobacter sp. H35-D1]
MTYVSGAAGSHQATRGDTGPQRRALGAAERRRWSSLVRQEDIDTVLASLLSAQLHGSVILGPRGVGKTTLARSVVRRLGEASHVVRLFGSGVPTEVPYAIFSVYLAKLNAQQTDSPAAVLAGLVEQILREARGRPIVVVLDELPGIDTLSMGVLMHLVLGRKAKLLVVARSAVDFPEDLVWMVKDGLMAQHRIGPFSRAEVRTLLVKALGGPVAESVVASLHAASAGNPLVLQALVHEYRDSGLLRSYDGIWVPFGRLDKVSDDILLELVEARLARESEAVRRSVEKFSLVNTVPLALAIEALGVDSLSCMEERGFLTVATDRHRTVAFAEPYIGEIVRNQLTTAQKAAYFVELSSVLTLDTEAMNMQERLTFAAWIHGAGMVMQPTMALAAAQAALHYFDPQLAIAYSAHVPAGHHLAVQAVQKRSRAHYVMANYVKAAEVLEEIEPAVLGKLSAADYASWTLDLAVALLWVPQRADRIAEVLADAEVRKQEAPAGEQKAAEKFLNLARFEVHVHRGEFSPVLDDLEAASRESGDREYRLNCACMLTMAWAATGREMDAVELSRAIDAESTAHNVVLRMNDWHLYGRIFALTWSGQWRSCEAVLRQAIEYSNDALHYRGGAMELALGVVYAFAGRRMQSADVLLTAAAQLEVRDTYKSLVLVYSALACVYAKLDEPEQAQKYLALADAATLHTAWINRTLSDYFQALARHALGDPAAPQLLVSTAKEDWCKGRPTPASTGLLGAIMAGSEQQYEFLEEASRRCQGPLAGIGILLARAHNEKAAKFALEAADAASALELPAIQQHANERALRLAKAAGEKRVVREAKSRLQTGTPEHSELAESVVVALTPRELQVARLAIRGMANREIASKIGVSVRTVEGHLYQVFAKLGITSRAELEKWVNL